MPAAPRGRLPPTQRPPHRGHVPAIAATEPKQAMVLRTVGQKRQRPLGAQVRRLPPLGLLAQALGAVAGQELRPKDQPVLGVVDGVGVVIEPKEAQRAKAPLEPQGGNARGRQAA